MDFTRYNPNPVPFVSFAFTLSARNSFVNIWACCFLGIPYPVSATDIKMSEFLSSFFSSPAEIVTEPPLLPYVVLSEYLKRY